MRAASLVWGRGESPTFANSAQLRVPHPPAKSGTLQNGYVRYGREADLSTSAMRRYSSNSNLRSVAAVAGSQGTLLCLQR